MLLSPTTDLSTLKEELSSLPTVQFDHPSDWTEESVYNKGAEIADARDQYNQMIENRDVSFIRAVRDSARFETITGSVLENAFDSFQSGDEDPTFSTANAVERAKGTLPNLKPEELDVLRKAKNNTHADLLIENLADRRAFLLDCEAMGMPLTFAAQMFAELGNIPNYIPFTRMFGLAKAPKLTRAIYEGIATGVTNVAEEAAINQYYGGKTMTNYITSFTLGAGLGAASTLANKAQTKVDLDSAVDVKDRAIRVAERQREADYMEQLDKQKNGDMPLRDYTDSAFLRDDAGNLPDDIIEGMSTKGLDSSSELDIALYVADSKNEIPQTEKLLQEYVGLGSMAQSMSRSDNPFTRFANKMFFEHGEMDGSKAVHTAALDADLLVNQHAGRYSMNEVLLSSAWAKEAEAVGYTYKDFSKELGKYINQKGDYKTPKATPGMHKILEQATENYRTMNKAVADECRAAGVPEFKAEINDLHLFREYNLENFHLLTTKHNDGGKAVKATLSESIRKGKGFLSALRKTQADLKAAGKAEEVDVDALINKMSEAIYNRMLQRATVNIADANLLSTSNRRLLMSALEDANLTKVELDHIKYILDTQGRDIKTNPMKEQISMDLTVKVGDIAMTDLLHTPFGAKYISRMRYWLGRSALARKGDMFSTMEGLDYLINKIDTHGTKIGMDRKDIIADKNRVQAGINMILGQPVDPAEMGKGWSTAMRVMRKSVGLAGLNKLGLIQYGESGRAVAMKGVSFAMQLPEIAKLTSAIITGKVNSDVLRNIEDHAVGQFSSRLYMQHPDIRMDDYGMDISRAEKFLDKMQYMQSIMSGWNRVHRVQLEYVTDGLAQKWYREVMNDKFPTRHMKELGIDGLDVKAIKAEMKKHAEPADGLSKYSKAKNLNIDKWNPTVRRKFALMLHRKSNNAVQDIMAGETPLWMNTAVGKLLGQYRSFSVAALSKQTTRDYKMLRQGDMETALALQFMLTTSTMATLAKTYYQSLSLDEKDRQKFLKEKLALPALVTSVMSYHGDFSMLADVGGTTSSALFGVGLDGNRVYSGRGITSLIPSLNYIDKAYKGVTGVLQAPTSGYTRSDAKSFYTTLPMQGLWGFDVAVNQAVINQLPK